MKTTITGLISAATSFVIFAQQLNILTFPKWAIAVAMFANVGGLAALGISAKDFNQTGGTVPTTPEAFFRTSQQPVAAAIVSQDGTATAKNLEGGPKE